MDLTREHISALASTYADGEYNGSTAARDNAKDVLCWLSQHFLIVGKDAVGNIRNLIDDRRRFAVEYGLDRLKAIARAENTLLDNLFPEIGKEPTK